MKQFQIDPMIVYYMTDNSNRSSSNITINFLDISILAASINLVYALFMLIVIFFFYKWKKDRSDSIIEIIECICEASHSIYLSTIAVIVVDVFYIVSLVFFFLSKLFY